jgi:hypothetical protein
MGDETKAFFGKYFTLFKRIRCFHHLSLIFNFLLISENVFSRLTFSIILNNKH